MNNPLNEIIDSITLKTELWLFYYNNLLIANNTIQKNYIKICDYLIQTHLGKSLNYDHVQDLEIILVLICIMEDTLICTETHTNIVLKYISAIIANIKSLPKSLLRLINIKIPRKEDESLFTTALAKCRKTKETILLKEHVPCLCSENISSTKESKNNECLIV